MILSPNYKQMEITELMQNCRFSLLLFSSLNSVECLQPLCLSTAVVSKQRLKKTPKCRLDVPFLVPLCVTVNPENEGMYIFYYRTYSDIIPSLQKVHINTCSFLALREAE